LSNEVEKVRENVSVKLSLRPNTMQPDHKTSEGTIQPLDGQGSSSKVVSL